MKNLHIKMEYSEAVSEKKEVLASEISILELLKRFKNYRSLRKKELILKSELKKNLVFAEEKICELQAHLPKEEITGKEQKIIKNADKINRSIEFQLQEIREKLAVLG